jgi:predicted Mrr-cat superfamily restriction endonuclease
MWMVRNGNGDYAAAFIDQGIVSVGWSEAGALNILKTREQVARIERSEIRGRRYKLER